MEKRFYFFPVQTLANSRVEDRGQALHITGEEWHRISKHLDRKKDIQEALEIEESKRKYLEEGSKNMIKNWDNSLENIRKRKEEARFRRLEGIKEDRMRRFFQMREEQAEIRKQYVEKVKKQMFMETGWARDINSGYVLSEVIYEREKQKEFKKFVQSHEGEVEMEYAKVVKVNAEKEAEEKAEELKRFHEGRKEYGEYLRNVIKEKQSNEQKVKETQMMKEALDNIMAVKEMEFLKKKQEEQKLLEKMEMKKDKEKYLKSVEEFKNQIKQEEKEVDDVLAIYQKAKHEIDCLKKQKEEEKQAAIIARRELIAKMVMAEETARAETEENCLKAAIAERDANEEAKVRARAEYDAKMRQERLDDRRRYLDRKKEEQRKEEELRKWEMINRYKIGDFTKEYEENKKKELWQNILRRRMELLEQMDEDDKRRLSEKEMDDCLSKISFAGDDAKFFEYADEVMELAKKKGRSTYPIERVILEYKKFNRLLLEGKKCTACEHIRVEDKKNRSRGVVNKSFKKSCKCNVSK